MLSTAEAINFIQQSEASIEPLENCYRMIKKLLEDNLYIAERDNNKLAGLALYYKINKEDIKNLPDVCLNWQMLPNRSNGEIAFIDSLVIKNNPKLTIKMRQKLEKKEPEIKYLLWYNLKNNKWQFGKRRKI